MVNRNPRDGVIDLRDERSISPISERLNSPAILRKSLAIVKCVRPRENRQRSLAIDFTTTSVKNRLVCRWVKKRGKKHIYSHETVESVLVKRLCLANTRKILQLVCPMVLNMIQAKQNRIKEVIIVLFLVLTLCSMFTFLFVMWEPTQTFKVTGVEIGIHYVSLQEQEF